MFPRSGKFNSLIWGGVLAGGILVLGLGLPGLVKAYSFDLGLTGGDAAARAELTESFGGEGSGWSMTGGQFVSDGYLLDGSSALQIKLPDDLPVGHVQIQYEAKGIDNSVASAADGDGYMFSIWNAWCDPCPATGYNAACDASNWGFGLKKWPSGLGHLYSNSILVQGTGMENGAAVPGANVGDSFDWEEYAGFYTVELDLHAGTSNGALSVWKGDPNAGAGPVLHSPSGVPYGLLNTANRDGLGVSLGAEGPGGPSYGGVTLRNVRLSMEGEAAPADHPTYPQECTNKTNPDDFYGACACVGGSPDAPLPCEDPVQPGDTQHATFLDQFPFDFSGWSIVWNWTIEGMMREGDAKEKQDQSPPEINLQFAPPAPQEGEEAGAIAAPMYFRTRPNNLYYAWCLVDGDKVWPMNSVVAGGTRPENASGKSFEDNGCCGPITRTPPPGDDQEDTDGDGQPEGDGMSDNWEREHFVGRTVNGRTYNSIEDVLPGDDPDSDGFVASNFKNENGQYLTVAPAMVDSLGNKYVPGVTGIFSNIEEYIVGTDPLNGDTDGDGNGDEMDYEGVGQSNVTFTVDKPAGPTGYYDIGVAAAGIDGARKTAIVSTRQRLFIGDDKQVKVALSANQEVLTMGSDQSVNIQAQLEGGAADNRVLYYEWSFNGDSACDQRGYENADLCDTGKSELIIGAGGISQQDLPPTTSEDYTIGVKVTDPGSRKEAETTLVMPVAYVVTLTTACNGSTTETTTLPMGSTTPLTICIAEIEEIARSYDVAALNFVWSVDGLNQENQSGLGQKQFVLTSQGAAGNSHVVAVKIKDVNRAREFANSSLRFGIGGPSVAIVDPADRITSSDEVTPEATRYVAAQPGEAIPFGATQENFVGAEGWIVSWLVDGAVVNSYPLSDFAPGDEHLFTFPVPATAAPGQVYTVGISITALDNDPPEAAADSLAVVVGAASASAGAYPFFGNLAAVFNQIPEIFRNVIVYAGILAGIFFSLVWLYPKASRFLENRQAKK